MVPSESSKATSTHNKHLHANAISNSDSGMGEIDGEGRRSERLADEGLDLRMKARQIGTASILAWGETMGRYGN